MTDQELRDKMMTLLLAAPSAMAWGLYWIHHLPQVHEPKLLPDD
jgi:cytochrome P450